jgi:hypothetical protein
MTTLATQLREVIAAVSIEPPLGFTWCGRPGPALSDEIRAAMSAEQTRAFLHGTLQLHLYSHYYSSGGVVPVRRPAAVPHRSTAFVDELSAANAGRGPWQRGWELRQLLDDGDIIARRNGLTVRAEKAEWRPGPTPRGAGAAVSLRLPKEARARQPGFYVVFSDADFDSGGTDGLVRLYWNVRADGAARLVRHVTTLLNGAGIAFGLKLLSEPASYDLFV